MEEENVEVAVSEDDIKILLPQVYEELKRSARRELRKLPVSSTLNTTALVHETYLRLIGNSMFNSRGHFLRVMSIAMRRALIDLLRAGKAAKRGSGVEDIPLDENIDIVVEDEESVIKVHEALETLKAVDPKLVAIVECRFFAGFTDTETAEALNVSVRTVRRHWPIARAWLKKEMEK